MPYKDPVKAKANALERSRRYYLKKKIEKFGPDSIGKNMSGKHGNQQRGPGHVRWNSDKLKSSHGYVLVRVPLDHPHGFGPDTLADCRYAYEHIIVMMNQIGRPLAEHEVVHHKNGIKDDNRIDNLELKTRGEHSSDHVSVPGARDSQGRFAKGKRTADPSKWGEGWLQQMPGVAK